VFEWTPKMIDFMRDASEYNNYHEILSKKIKNYFNFNSHICDAGCGLGYLSLAVSDKFEKVTSIDVSDVAIDVLKNNISENNYRNINIIEGDIWDIEPDHVYDGMIFCFFGNINEILKIAKMQCSGKVIIVKRNWKNHRFSKKSKNSCKKNRGFSYRYAKEFLKKSDIPFECETLNVEMGQPFRTVKDAVEFFKIYDKTEENIEFSESNVYGRLRVEESNDFPYYYSSKREIGIIVLNTSDIPNCI
jgi:protein-L-isoaspartate O-methyltransferase